MATIQGRDAMVRRGFGKFYVETYDGGVSYLQRDGKWHNGTGGITNGYWPTEAAAQAFIEQHCDKPATPAAESEETTVATKLGDWTVRRIGDVIAIIDEQGRLRHRSRGHSLTAVYLAGMISDLPFESTPQVDSVMRMAAERFAPTAESDSGECERLRAERDDIMDLLKRSFMEHGDCKSGKRYNGLPRACTACMAQLRLKELVSQWKGRQVRLA